MSQPWVVRGVLRTVERLPGYPDLAVLDLSCGEGEILAALDRAGCRCRGTHYRDEDYVVRRPRDVLGRAPIDEGIDLVRPLRYRDASFDVVVMSEVLEHLATHVTVVREVGRVLKPGGYFVFTTPNVHRVHSRWHFFLTGTHKLIRRRVGWDLGPDDLYAYHIHPVDFPLMHTLLFQSKLRVMRLGFTKFKLRHAYWLLLYPLFWLATRIAFRGRPKEPAAYDLGQRDLFRWMVHPAVLTSEQLLVVARRELRQARPKREPPSEAGVAVADRAQRGMPVVDWAETCSRVADHKQR
jgi:SAM-dependent methyltransferase